VCVSLIQEDILAISKNKMITETLFTPENTLETTQSTLATAQHHLGNHPQHTSIVFRKIVKSSLIYFYSDGINGVIMQESGIKPDNIAHINPSKLLISQVKRNSINVQTFICFFLNILYI